MAISLVGNGGTVAEVDGTIFRALKVTTRPPEYGAGGYFRMAISGTTAAAPAAAAPLMAFRWTSGTLLALVKYIEIKIQVSTASTAGLPEMSGYIARGWTASDTGGTAVVMTGNNQKFRVGMGTSVVGDVRAATAGVLTAGGGRTLDANPIITVNTPLALGATDRATFDINSAIDHPLVLGTNEGLVFSNVTALTAGIYRYTVSLGWAEVASY
jgi:hypothetical protein